jgi:hypothetical protein
MGDPCSVLLHASPHPLQQSLKAHGLCSMQAGGATTAAASTNKGVHVLGGGYLEQESHRPVQISVSMAGDAHIPHMVTWNCCDSR